MLLAFDVGNTNIVLGVFKDGELIQNWRLETDPRKSADEYGMVINQLFTYEGLDVKDVEDIIISTVVPSVLYTLQHLSVKYFNKRAIVVGPGVKTGLVVKYDNPKQVGADRIVNAVAAHAKYGGPLVILDFGTAVRLGRSAGRTGRSESPTGSPAEGASGAEKSGAKGSITTGSSGCSSGWICSGSSTGSSGSGAAPPHPVKRVASIRKASISAVAFFINRFSFSY